MSYGWRILDGVSVELCDECGFDARVASQVGPELESVWADLMALLQHSSVDVKPSRDVWSARRYVDHCVEVTKENLEWVAETGVEVSQREVTDPAAASQECAAVTSSLMAEDWHRAIVVDDRFEYDVDVTWILKHTLHDLQHHALDIRKGYAGLALPASAGFTIRAAL